MIRKTKQFCEHYGLYDGTSKFMKVTKVAMLAACLPAAYCVFFGPFRFWQDEIEVEAASVVLASISATIKGCVYGMSALVLLDWLRFLPDIFIAHAAKLREDPRFISWIVGISIGLGVAVTFSPLGFWVVAQGADLYDSPWLKWMAYIMGGINTNLISTIGVALVMAESRLASITDRMVRRCFDSEDSALTAERSSSDEENPADDNRTRATAALNSKKGDMADFMYELYIATLTERNMPVSVGMWGWNKFTNLFCSSAVTSDPVANVATNQAGFFSRVTSPITNLYNACAIPCYGC